MFKFVTLFALVACAFAAPAPAPGYGLSPISPIIQTQAYVAAPALRASYVAQPALSYHPAPITTYAHTAPVVAAYHAPASSHQQLTKIDSSTSVVSHPAVAHYTAYQAPTFAYVH